MKKLRDIVEIYDTNSEGEKRFFKKHVVKKTADANGNDDKVFNASDRKTATVYDTKHGHHPPPKDKKVYEQRLHERRGGEGNQGDAQELVTHAYHNDALHQQSFMPIVKNLHRKMKKGTYDHEKATKLWGYHADRAAQSYHKEYGGGHGTWHQMFPKATRMAAAKKFADYEQDRIQRNEHGIKEEFETPYDDIREGLNDIAALAISMSTEDGIFDIERLQEALDQLKVITDED